MNNLFEPGSATDILSRLQKLTADTKPLWGKMSISQMLAHSQAPLEVALGEKKPKAIFFGLLFGGIARKQLLKETPFKKNLPTAPEFIVRDERKFDVEKKRLQELVQRFSASDPGKIAERSHPFFGKMTIDQWGVLQWKHLDHHLRQFGV